MQRIVRFIGEDGPRAYELTYQALGNFQAPANKRDEAESALDKLAAIGKPSKEKSPNPDFQFLSLNGTSEVTLDESEKDVILEALERIPWPTYALAMKRRAAKLFKDAEKVEA